MIDDRTPIIVGVGEVSERLDDADYSAASPAELAGRAARAAVADAGVADLGRYIDVIAAIRQFEISRETAIAPFGRADNLPRAVGRRVGADPARAILEITGGQGPQTLVNEMAHEIAAGRSEMALLAGAEAISTMRDLLTRGEKPDWSEAVGGSVEDRGYAVDGLAGEALVRHGATRPAPLYGACENARRGRLGLDRQAYRLEMGRLFAPFTKVAAANRHAMSRKIHSAQDIATVTPGNRLICDPFPRLVVSRDQANQGAAVLLTSVGKARALGISSDRWVFLRGGSFIKERPVIGRPDLSRSPAATAALQQAMDVAGVGLDEIGVIDLYSCFPIAVFNICDAFGLRHDDPRGLTVTGGLPYFGGAGNNYSMHAIAEVVRRLRVRPDALGLVGANGGYLSKYAVGIYSATPAGWRPFDSSALQAQRDATPRAALSEAFTGTGVIETFTVDHEARPRRAIVYGRNGAGERFIAASTEAVLVDQMVEHDPLGARVTTRSEDSGRNLILGVA